MELLGEIYARGAGIQRNFTKALEWLTLASKQQLFSAYNGLGYLHVKGYGVEKNNTKVKFYSFFAIFGQLNAERFFLLLVVGSPL